MTLTCQMSDSGITTLTYICRVFYVVSLNYKVGKELSQSWQKCPFISMLGPGSGKMLAQVILHLAYQMGFQAIPVSLDFFFFSFFIFYRFYYYYFFFRQRGREGEREGEKHQCVVAFHTPPTGDPACNPGMCPRLGIKLTTLWFAGQQSIH